MESAITWLTAAATVIWLGIGGYLAILAASQRGLAKRLRQLEQLRNDS